MLNNLLLLFFIMLSHSSSIRGMSKANNENNPHNWEAIVQEFTPALLEILSETDQPISYWLERLPDNTRTFLNNIHIDKNLRRLIDHCLNLKFTSEEVSKIIACTVDGIKPLQRSQRRKTLRYLISIIKNKAKPIKDKLVKKLNLLRDPNFVEGLNHSIIIDEETGKTGLMLAIETGNCQIFDLFLKCYITQGCSLNAHDYNRRDAMWYALQSGITYLVDKICHAHQTKLQDQEPIIS